MGLDIGRVQVCIIGNKRTVLSRVAAAAVEVSFHFPSLALPRAQQQVAASGSKTRFTNTTLN